MTELNTDAIEELKQFACLLADAAAAVTLDYFRTPTFVTNKEKGSGFDPVTEADKGAEQSIRALIELHYPDHAISGEEFGDKKTGSDFEWCLDPIDGTRAFISGLPTWGTLIALKYKGQPIIGIIDQPYIKERYMGWPGGASLNGTPISTRPCETLSDATMSTTDPALFPENEQPVLKTFLKETQLIRYGLDCYAYAALSNGFMDVVVETGLKPFDMMALIPVVKGAGGIAVNWSGDPAGTDGRLLALGDPSLLEAALAITTAH